MDSINVLTHQWAQSQNLFSQFAPETESTNEDAKSQFDGLGKDFALYLTDHQSNGKGRYQRRWENMSEGATLLSTWCFKSPHPLQPVFSPLVGLCLFQALSSVFGPENFWLKPPNDIYLAEGKLAGLLIEGSVQGSSQNVFVGLGLNVYSSPTLDIATNHLSSQFSIQPEPWLEFCSQLFQGIQQVIEVSKSNTIPSPERESLLQALNNQMPTFDKVLEDGSLCKNDKIISWHDL